MICMFKGMDYCQLTFLSALEMCINIYKLNLEKCQLALKKTKVKLDLLTDINMLLMVKRSMK